MLAKNMFDVVSYVFLLLWNICVILSLTDCLVSNCLLKLSYLPSWLTLATSQICKF